MDTHKHALIQLLHSEHSDIRHHASQVLANIGPPAVRLLIHELSHPTQTVRQCVARVLLNIGDRHTLPRKILLDERLTPRQRARTLESLRHVNYHEGGLTVVYPLPEIHLFCAELLNDSDNMLAEGAKTVLNELQQQTLLRASEREEEREPMELLRAAHGETEEYKSEELLRVPSPVVISPAPKSTRLLARLFHRP